MATYVKESRGAGTGVVCEFHSQQSRSLTGTFYGMSILTLGKFLELERTAGNCSVRYSGR